MSASGKGLSGVPAYALPNSACIAACIAALLEAVFVTAIIVIFYIEYYSYSVKGFSDYAWFYKYAYHNYKAYA